MPRPCLKACRDFIIAFCGAEGAAIDPVTGDFLFSTFGNGNHVIVVRRFAGADGLCGDGFDRVTGR